VICAYLVCIFWGCLALCVSCMWRSCWTCKSIITCTNTRRHMPTCNTYTRARAQWNACTDTTHVHIYIHTHVYVDVYVLRYVYVCVRVCVPASAMFRGVSVYDAYVYVYGTSIFLSIYVHTYIPPYTFSRPFTYVSTHTHTDT